MAGSKSDFLELELLDHVLGAAAYTAPATVYVGLWTTTLTDASTGSTAGEVSGGSYARVAVTNNATNWPAASAGAKSNGTAFAFPNPTANWGTVTHMAILDAATAGNVLYWADLTVSKTINNGDTPVEFPAGDIDLTEA